MLSHEFEHPRTPGPHNSTILTQSWVRHAPVEGTPYTDSRFGVELKRLLSRHHVTQSKLAARCGHNNDSSINQLCTGRRLVSLGLLQRIVTQLPLDNVERSDLLNAAFADHAARRRKETVAA